MREFDIKNVTKLTKFNIKNNKKQIIGWSIAIFSIMFLYMILFPSMKDIAEAEFNAMPEGLLELFGMDNLTSMNNFISYFGMIYNIILIAISIFAATFSANLLYKEEKTKTIEFLYSLKVSRVEIYVSKFVTAFLAVLAVVLSAAISTTICGFINGGETFVFMDFIQIVKISSFTAFFFMAISIALSGISAKVSMSAIGSGVVLVCYMLGFLANLLGTRAEWLKYLSPFEIFSPQNALLFDQNIIASLMIYFSLFVLFIFVGGYVYRKRDFNI